MVIITESSDRKVSKLSGVITVPGVPGYDSVKATGILSFLPGFRMLIS